MITIATVYVKNNDVEEALKELKKKYSKDNTYIEYIKHQNFIPKTERRRRAEFRARRRQNKQKRYYA